MPIELIGTHTNLAADDRHRGSAADDKRDWRNLWMGKLSRWSEKQPAQIDPSKPGNQIMFSLATRPLFRTRSCASILGMWRALMIVAMICAVSSEVAGQETATKSAAGSPGATTVIDGRQLPPPTPKFGGVIKNNAMQSKPWWCRASCHPKGHRTSCSS